MDSSDLDLVEDILAGGNTESEAETPQKHAEQHVEEQQEVSISDSCLKKCLPVSSDDLPLEFVGPPANSDVRVFSPKTSRGGKSDRKNGQRRQWGLLHCRRVCRWPWPAQMSQMLQKRIFCCRFSWGWKVGPEKIGKGGTKACWFRRSTACSGRQM